MTEQRYVYRLNRYNGDITRFPLVRETEKQCVYLDRDPRDDSKPIERRALKLSEYESWHGSFGDADVARIQVFEDKVAEARTALERAEATLAAKKAMPVAKYYKED